MKRYASGYGSEAAGNMPRKYTRREALRTATGAAVALGTRFLRAADASTNLGRVEGWPEAAIAGEAVLADGGNAVDAIVTAALVASVVAPQMCSPGGYGGSFLFGRKDGRVAAIDFNSTAPVAFREDVFPLDGAGNVVGRVNEIGWFAAGVPGILAGLQLALDRFGTRRFAQAAQPAIRFARDGFTVGAQLAGVLRGSAAQLRNDPASAALLLPNGEPPKAGEILHNRDLAALLETLALHGSVEPFYRGKIAAQIAAAFGQNGGLVGQEDLAAYQAREVEPLALDWNGFSIRTPPPTAGGLTALEALAVLKKLGWDSTESFDERRMLLETLRLAWHDRLRLLGDPDHADVPIGGLLSEDHISALADQVALAMEQGKPVAAASDGRTADGTIHLSAADGQGNFAALTLTHGGSFGAKVTVPGLGVTLGHGMSRFEPNPGHPNSPGPGKRPLHNMCPTIVLRDGRPMLALGGRGGRKIVNAVAEVLARSIGAGSALDEAVAAPRLHTEGDLALQLERSWPAEDAAQLEELGYQVRTASHATVSAVWRDANAELRTASR